MAFLEKFTELINAELPLIRALETAALELEDPDLKKRFLTMREELTKGASVTDSFRKHPDLFDNYHLAIIQAGEERGHVEEGFSRAAQSYRKNLGMAPLIPTKSLVESPSPAGAVSIENTGSVLKVMGVAETASQLKLIHKDLNRIATEMEKMNSLLEKITNSGKASS